jgi:ribose transport system substrate-binding protein
MKRNSQRSDPDRTQPCVRRYGDSNRHGARRVTLRWLTLPALMLCVTLALAACGSSKATSSAGTAAAGSTTGVKTAVIDSALAPYTGHPSAFPVDQPLGKPLPHGAKFVYLSCSSPVCGLLGQLYEPAVKAIGGTMTIINGGNTASSNQAAAASALALHPSAVLLAATTPSLFGNSLNKLEAAGVKVVGGWISDPQAHGITYSVGGPSNQSHAGALMADWVITHNGAKANVVFYSTPELGYSPALQQGFQQEMAKQCTTCKVRIAQLSLATFGTTAPSTILHDLQAHSGTTTAVFASMDATIGLPAALKTAGLSVTTFGFSPESELPQIASGQLTGGLGFDLPVQAWTVVDAAARLVLGEKVPPQEANVPLEVLGKQQIISYPTKQWPLTHGWTGYPSFPARFVKLWTGH